MPTLPSSEVNSPARSAGRGAIAVALSALALTAVTVLAAPWSADQTGAAQAPAAQPPAAQTAKPGELGYEDTPTIPGQTWRVHDVNRPAPTLVTPGATPGAPPSDAIVLFDGKDLSKWAQRGPNGELVEPKWPVRDGYFETGAKSGSMFTRESFGDGARHGEWAAPADPTRPPPTCSCTSSGPRRQSSPAPARAAATAA